MTPPQPLPRTIERLGELLVPPAAAEHVLGDLAECSHTPREYLRRLLAVLPYVVLAQARDAERAQEWGSTHCTAPASFSRCSGWHLLRT